MRALRRRTQGALWLTGLLALLGLMAGAGSIASPGADAAERRALAAHLHQAIRQSDSFADRYDAAVWLTDMQTRLASFVTRAEERLTLLRRVHSAAAISDLPPELVLAVIEVESHFDRFAVSRVGAQGYMQVMPFWKNEIGRPDDNLTDPETNLRYGCHILQFYLKRENGNLRHALAAYNGSSGSEKYPDKVHRAWYRHWKNGELHW